MIVHLIVASVAFFLGWYASDIRKRVKRIEILSLIRHKKENPEKPKSSIVENLTTSERAIKEHEELLESINR